MAISMSLTKEQWAEIYYALDTKTHLIKDGFFGPEEKRGENKRWIEDIQAILTRIADKVDV